VYKRILVPLDGSPLSEAVLPHAQALAQAEGAEILILRVAVNPSAEFSFSDPALASELIQEMEAETQTYLKDLCSKLESTGIRTAYLMRKGPIAETILEVAGNMQADMIAMSTHGRSGLQRWLIGSIADRIVHHSSVPVLLIRPQSD
jgi:nucleotide-binding universal stress UspA family protein